MPTYYRSVNEDGDPVSVQFTDDNTIRQEKNSGAEVTVIDVVIPSGTARKSDDPTLNLLEVERLTPEGAARANAQVTSSIPKQEMDLYSRNHPPEADVDGEERPGSKDHMAIPELPPTPKPQPILDFTGSLKPTPIFVESNEEHTEPEQILDEVDEVEEEEKEPEFVQDPSPVEADTEQQEAVEKGEPFVPEPVEEVEDPRPLDTVPEEEILIPEPEAPAPVVGPLEDILTPPSDDGADETATPVEDHEVTPVEPEPVIPVLTPKEEKAADKADKKEDKKSDKK